MIIQDIVQKDPELKKSLAPILQYIDFTILGIDRSIVSITLVLYNIIIILYIFIFIL